MFDRWAKFRIQKAALAAVVRWAKRILEGAQTGEPLGPVLGTAMGIRAMGRQLSGDLFPNEGPEGTVTLEGSEVRGRPFCGEFPRRLVLLAAAVRKCKLCRRRFVAWMTDDGLWHLLPTHLQAEVVCVRCFRRAAGRQS